MATKPKQLATYDTARDCAYKITESALRAAEGRGMGTHYALGIMQGTITTLLQEKFTEAEVKKIVDGLKDLR